MSATPSRLAGLLAAGAVAAVIAQPQQPPPFRSGTNIVRVDATVVDSSGRPVETLTADDFEVREDGAVQPVTSFKFLSNTGEPSDDRSLPIRSQRHAAAEAARDDVRVFLVFWDEYHIGRFESALRAREALSRVMLTAFGPTDLVAIMDPLTPSNAIEFTRDRRALADRVHRLEGRSRVYLPPRSAVEEEQLKAVNWQAERVEPFRTQVTATAIRAAAAHLGTLREGRKTMVVLTEGFGAGSMDGQNFALDIVRTANDSNTAVHVVDPRGLMGAGWGSMLDTLASGSGGELHRSNDMGQAFQRLMAQSSATYLLGYTREQIHDGRFHEIRVRVKPRGYEVRARAGYWAPKPGDVERAKTAAAAAVLPESMAAAFASLNPPNSARLVDVWIGSWPTAEGRSLVTVAWMPVATPPAGAVPATVSVRLTSGELPAIEKIVDRGGTSFEVPDGSARLAIQVLDKAGEVLDRETRPVETSTAGKAALGLTAVLHRAKNQAEVRTLSAGTAPIHAGRDFVRTDRLLIRVRPYGPAAPTAALTGRLIDRRGATLTSLSIASAAEGWHHLDLPLGSIAPGDFAVIVEARSGTDRAEAVVPLRVGR